MKILERNLIEAREHIGSITCTSSLLNVNDLFEIRNHYREVVGLETYFHNIVVNPPMLSCKNAKNKEELLEKYIGDDFEMLRSELKKDFDKQELQQGMEYCLSLSKHRNIDFQEIFSDVAGRVF